MNTQCPSYPHVHIIMDCAICAFSGEFMLFDLASKVLCRDCGQSIRMSSCAFGALASSLTAQHRARNAHGLEIVYLTHDTVIF